MLAFARHAPAKARWTVATAARREYTVLVMGAPGGGKGTISKYMVRDFGFLHLSTGDVLRDNVARATPVGLEAKKYMDAGDLVPDRVIVDLVVSEIRGKEGGRLLLDGFPRTTPQAEALGAHLAVDAAINLDIPQEVIIERISNRWVHAPSGRTYAYDFNPPKVHGKDDETGEALVQRDDDKPETVRARLETYAKNTQPLIDYYGAKGVLTNFPGTESKVIYRDVKAFLERVLPATEAA